ncbi:hypothetical protein ACIBQ1_15630 [Nonomuraea sp. NPDC050153]|uniref:hypothetical protein n=1 Tax=Nonomuraea sp. NPDC050153 TaxID=3364359 RepID=UPI0037A3EA2B
MRSAVRVAAGDGFHLDAVTCVDDHRGWSAAQVGPGHRLVLVRRGRFRRMADGRAVPPSGRPPPVRRLPGRPVPPFDGPERVLRRPYGGGRDAGQAGCSARSPDQSVWKEPSLSTRR